MSIAKNYNLRDIYSIERKLLLFCGIYPNDGSLGKFLYYISTFYHVSVSVLITLSMVIFLTINIENLLSVIEAFLFLATQLAFLFKLFNILMKKQNLLQIEEILSNPEFYRYTKKQKATIEGFARSTKTFGMFYRSICCVVCSTYAIFPLMDEDQWALPLSGWNPINIDSKFKYWVIFIFQWMSYFMSAYINTGIDVLIYMLITIATSQFEILKQNLRDMEYDALGADDEFAMNVVLHYEILRLVNTIEKTFSLGTFIQFFCSVVVICFTEFEMIIVPPNSVHFVSICMYFNAMTFQMAMYCWFGHNIIASSDGINEAIYMSNWYESDSRIKKSVMIFMERCKKPVVLTASKIFPLSLVTFTGLMRSSYSYLTVLQRLYHPN